MNTLSSLFTVLCCIVCNLVIFPFTCSPSYHIHISSPSHLPGAMPGPTGQSVGALAVVSLACRMQMPRWFDFANKVSCHSQHFCELPQLPRLFPLAPLSTSPVWACICFCCGASPQRTPPHCRHDWSAGSWPLLTSGSVWLCRNFLSATATCPAPLCPCPPPPLPCLAKPAIFLFKVQLYVEVPGQGQGRATEWRGHHSMGCCAIWVSLIGRCQKLRIVCLLCAGLATRRIRVPGSHYDGNAGRKGQLEVPYPTTLG